MRGAWPASASARTSSGAADGSTSQPLDRAPADDATEAMRDVGGTVVVLLDVQSIVSNALL